MIRRLALGGAMLLAAAGLAGAPGCAHIEAPTGGPVDSIAPVLISIRPDTNAVLERWVGPVVFEFDEALLEEGVQEAVTRYWGTHWADDQFLLAWKITGRDPIRARRRP